MTDDELVEKMNAHAPPALKSLGGQVAYFDGRTGVAEMHYTANESHCHSGDIVQGGFIAGMLDAAMAHAVFGAIKAFAIARLGGQNGQDHQFSGS
jgi:acyl-coenzyme A thioesterase PaaI-like protein